MQVRHLWDSYWGRIVSGLVVLFVGLPFLTHRVLDEDYSLGVYIGTGIAILWYTVETYYVRQNAWTANQAGLLKQILEEYDASAKNRDVLQEWWRRDAPTAIARYVAEVQAGRVAELPVHEPRRKVSQYFLRLRALCEKGFLDDGLVAETLGDEPVQVFLRYVDPLDEVLRREHGLEHKTAEREYFRGYLRKFFPETADHDPWGLRSRGPASGEARRTMMDHKFEVKTESKSNATVEATVIRGAETWQFFAFVFAALVTLALALLEEMSAGRWRIAAKVVAFLGRNRSGLDGLEPR